MLFYDYRWSYGVFLWEMYTYGRQPLANIEPRDVLAYLTDGNRLNRSDNCPQHMWVGGAGD